MKFKSQASMSAQELLDRLRADPEWVRENEERAKRHQASVAQLQSELAPEEAPLIEALRQAGYEVTSVWDLVNSDQPYPGAIPVLCEFFKGSCHPVLREGIVRALTVPESRGVATTNLLTALMRSGERESPSVRWALANALTVVADKSTAGEIQE